MEWEINRFCKKSPPPPSRTDCFLCLCSTKHGLFSRTWGCCSTSAPCCIHRIVRKSLWSSEVIWWIGILLTWHLTLIFMVGNYREASIKLHLGVEEILKISFRYSFWLRHCNYAVFVFYASLVLFFLFSRFTVISIFTGVHAKSIIFGSPHPSRVKLLPAVDRNTLQKALPFLTANQKVLGTVPAWSRVEVWATFSRHTVSGQGQKIVGLVSRRSIKGFKRANTLIDKSRLLPMLSTVRESHLVMSDLKLLSCVALG